jgi:hypothetical protein
MELRTNFNIEPSSQKITYNDPVMFIGSCFSAEIGVQMETGHMPVMINPFGTVYNPVSVSQTLDLICDSREFTENDLYLHDGTWHSFRHYTDFSSEDPDKVLNKINNRTRQASSFLKNAKFLFITFGTARVYRFLETGEIVSNCHKIPSVKFESELLTPGRIADLWAEQLDKLQSTFPLLKIVFTISPVRHWKNGAHGNQVSKSVLFLATELLLGHKSQPGYFPAYELLMDDLRDYRYYAEDMLHPSSLAINYIWEAFSGCYLDKSTQDTWHEVKKISRATGHHFLSDSPPGKRAFAEHMLKQIAKLNKVNNNIDLSLEKDYFMRLLE